MKISSMSHPKALPLSIKNVPASFIFEFIVDNIVNKNNIGDGPDLINTSTIIHSMSRAQLFSSSMSDNFFLGCIGLSSCVSIRISDSSCMISCFIMIALNMKFKESNDGSDIIIFIFEVNSVLNVSQIRYEWITT